MNKNIKKWVNYQMKLDITGVFLFFVLMIPTFFWLVFPTTNDVLRIESATPVIDLITSISQIVMIITMCLLVRKNLVKSYFFTFMLFLTVGCCLIYYLGWFMYYQDQSSFGVILVLTVAPSCAFLSYQIAKKIG